MKRTKLHYGWVIAFVSFCVIFVALGLCNSPYGLYQIPITSTTSMSRTQFSSIATCRFVTAALVNAMFGAISLRVGLKRCAAIGMVTLSASLVTLSLGNHPVIFYIGGLLFGVGNALATTALVSALISNWFNRYRGAVLGTVLCASGIGGALFSKLVVGWITGYGWRVSFRISAVILIAVGIFAFILIRDRPSLMGLTPLGDAQDNPIKAAPADGDKSIMLKDACRSPLFYLLMLAFFLAGVLNNPVYVSVPAQMVDNGFSAENAATMTSIVFISIAAAKVLLGIIHDKLGVKLTVAICFIANIGGILILLVAKSFLSYCLFAAIFGFSVPMENLMQSLILSDLFGRKHLTSYVGLSLAVCSIGMAAGNPIVGFFYDYFHSYQQILWVALVASGIACAATFVSIRCLGAKRKALQSADACMHTAP